MALELNQTALLVDAFRPPPGMELDAAVGATFTLDLTALLTIPTASWSASAGGSHDASADILESIRRYASRTLLFCQAGAISVPRKYQNAHTLIDQIVVEVRKPSNGIFHPKFWALRFAGQGRTFHRVALLSRNLTFDRALDLIVTLDEDPESEEIVNTDSFVQVLRSLPRVSARKMVPRQKRMLRDLAHTLDAANLKAPSPFTGGRIVALSPGPKERPFHEDCDNALAISPFLTAKAAADFTHTAREWAGVVSRRSSLESVAHKLEHVQLLSVIDDLPNAQESMDWQDAPVVHTGSVLRDVAAHGLHAKLYLQDVGDSTTWWLGSANLTSSAFTRNHETLVELTGPKTKVGVDAVLFGKAPRSLSSVTENFVPHEDASNQQEDDELSQFEITAFEVASRTAQVVVTPNGVDYNLDFDLGPQELPGEVNIEARPLSRTRLFMSLRAGRATWPALPLSAVTPFVVLRLHHGSLRRDVLIRADLHGDPPHRSASVIAGAIASREDFLSYLAALLGYGGSHLSGDDGDGSDYGSAWGDAASDDRLLEDLMTSAARNPERLDTLQETLELLAVGRNRDAVPPEFFPVWGAVRSAAARTKP